MIADDMSNYDEEGTSLYAILPILLLWAVTRYTYLQNALRDWARHVKSRTQKLKECVDRRAYKLCLGAYVTARRKRV